jgi:RimJ/RimL family protein N-acetyltransferase
MAAPSIWEFTSTVIESEEQLRQYLQKAIADREAGTRMQFTIIEKAGGHCIGNTSIGNISPENKRAEIGWTWLGKAYQGKGYNPAIKYLLLDYLFTVAGFARVEFRTRDTNIRSQKALEKIGATREGLLRNYFAENGVYYGLVYYSILADEWPALRQQSIFRQ